MRGDTPRALPGSGLRPLANASGSNLDGLPVGFVAGEGAGGRRWFGFTCAACHTGEIHLGDTAYRVAQEAIGNARRHAAPSRVTVQLTREHEELVVRVSDDGQGFDPDGVGARPGHRGLLGARERAEAAGGIVELTSRPGGGTTVTCRVPWLLGASFDGESVALDQERPRTSRATSSTSSTPLST